MPSSRRLKVTGLVALLTVCIVFYVTNGARSTHNSAFYTRTVQAINDRHAAEARENVIAEERQRLERVDRLQKEHDVAIAAAAAEETHKSTSSSGTGGTNAGMVHQKPIVPDPYAGKGSEGKSVAGRKMMSADGKVVHDKPAKDGDDGVAKVGNVGPQSSHAAKSREETEEDEKVESELNSILRKGPIIIFSKSYCPFSKKAKVSSSDTNMSRRRIDPMRLTQITAYPSRPVYHNATSIRRGAGQARARLWPTISVGKDDRKEDRPKRPGQRKKYWWRR